MTTFRGSFLVLAALAAAACSPPPPADGGDAAPPDATPMDMGTPDTTPPPPDVPADDGARPEPVEFGPCTSNSDCLPDWMCQRNTDGYPGGWCTRMCTTAADCEGVVDSIQGICPTVTSGPRLCQRRCLNGYDCGREGGYTCAPLSAMMNICVPSCDDASCGAGATCNPWTGRCLPAGTMPAAGAGVGEPCTRTGMGSECRSSQCNLERSATSGVYTGWNRGYCIGTCALPAGWNSSSLWPTDTFPRGNCPMGAICFPGGGGLAQYDIGTCVDECTTDSDCRVADGYYCRKTFNRNRTQPYTWRNGFCAPRDCNVAGMTCPAGLICEVQVRGTARVGVCRPPPPPPDAGPDSGPDASPDVVDTDVPGDMGPADSTSTDSSTTDGGLDAAAD